MDNLKEQVFLIQQKLNDLFEGVVEYDMALFLRYFVNKKWFTLEVLNDKLKQFPLKGRDAADMLTKVNLGGKINGHAVQNWYFLRFLPMMVYMI